MKRPRQDVKNEAARSLCKGSEVKAPTGRRCAVCAKIVKPENDQGGQEAFCGPDCFNSREDRLSDAKLRALVLERDRGVCALCKVDCIDLRAELDALLHNTYTGIGATRKCLARIHQLVRCGFDRHAVESGAALWEMAHIQARVQGGANVLSNVSSLCLSCHKGDSKKLARDRASSRRPRRFGR